MSRTIRCKNFEIENDQTSWSRWGKKTALEYTARSDEGWYETGVVKTYKRVLSFTRWGVAKYETTVYKERKRYLEHPMAMEGRKHFRHWYYMHGESRHANQRTPGRFYRQHRQNQNRSINKQELAKWIKAGGEYEPMFEANPRSHYWDWS